jgi:Mg-chelatase subunit ChlD
MDDEKSDTRLDLEQQGITRRRLMQTSGAVALAGAFGVGLGAGTVGAQEGEFDDLCAAVPNDVMLVLDRSGSMSGTKLANAKDGATTFVDQLTATDEAGLVSFSSGASLDQGISSDLGAVKTEINGLVAGGLTNIEAAIDLAQTQFPNRQGAGDIMVLLSDGLPQNVTGAKRAATDAKAAGTRLITIAYSAPSQAEALLAELASDPDSVNAFNASTDNVEDIFTTIAQEICPLEVEINIKPGSDPNAVNCGSKGGTPVAVLTTDTFDATTVDPSSLRFGSPSEIVAGNGASIIHTGGHFEDAKPDSGPKDGDTDFVGHFYTPDTGFSKTDTEGWLVGKTTDGRTIAGKDSVKIVGRCN